MYLIAFWYYSVFAGVLVLYSVFKGVLILYSVFKGVLVKHHDHDERRHRSPAGPRAGAEQALHGGGVARGSREVQRAARGGRLLGFDGRACDLEKHGERASVTRTQFFRVF